MTNPPLSIVIDTNVVLSALISQGTCLKILDLWTEEKVMLCCTKETIHEIKTVGMRESFRSHFSVSQLISLITLITNNSRVVKPSQPVPVQYTSPDPKDNIFISCIVASKPDYFITGNMKHFMHINDLTNVISPRNFLDIMMKKEFRTH